MAGGAQAAPALLALAGLASAGDPSANRSDRAVGALLGVLLCLAVALAAAWRHLCRLSAGRYHPCPMGRRALDLLRGHWHRRRAPGHRGDTAAPAPRGEEEELMPWSRDGRPRGEEEEEEEERQDGAERPAREEEEEEEEEEEGAGGSTPGVGGSAEALLSDLHAFSGTAAWGDTRPHVTAL